MNAAETPQGQPCARLLCYFVLDTSCSVSTWWPGFPRNKEKTIWAPWRVRRCLTYTIRVSRWGWQKPMCSQLPESPLAFASGLSPWLGGPKCFLSQISRPAGDFGAHSARKVLPHTQPFLSCTQSNPIHPSQGRSYALKD